MLQPRFLTCGLALVALAGCQMPLAEIDHSMEATQRLHQINPSDVAVLPVEDATPDRTATYIVDSVREAIAFALPKRGYAPLSPSMVDDVLASEARVLSTVSVLDANWLKSVGGRFGEDASLAVRLTQWDASSLMASGRVRFAADVRLVSPDSEAPLWSGSVRGEVKAGGEGPAPRDRTNRARAAADEFAKELILLLPLRQP